MSHVNATGCLDISDYGNTPHFTASLPGEEAVFTQQERRTLRGLAERVSRMSQRPREKEIGNLWYKHNNLEATRPLIVCDPENGWNKIITEDQLECISRLAKHREMVQRKKILWGERIYDDRLIEPVFCIGYTYRDSGFGVEEKYLHMTKRGSSTWIPGIREHRDIERLLVPVIEVDHESTQMACDCADEIFEDLLIVRKRGVWWWSLGLTYVLVVLRGMEQIMVGMIDEPSFVYELPARSFIGTVRRADIWGFAES